jgi:hypothetical protein
VNSDKIILDLCGGTGAWSKPYKDASYTVINITLPEYDINEYHLRFSVFMQYMDFLILTLFRLYHQ